jgi:proteasome assembly chaperone (PAC2) family protein
MASGRATILLTNIKVVTSNRIITYGSFSTGTNPNSGRVLKLSPNDSIVLSSGNLYGTYFLAEYDSMGNLVYYQKTYEGYSFDIIFINGKFGAQTKEGKITVEPIYEDAHFMEERMEIMIGYENGVKYYIYYDTNERFTEEQW